MVFANGCETMSMDGQRHGRPLLFARDERGGRPDLLLHPVAEPDRLGPSGLRAHPPGLAGRAEPHRRCSATSTSTSTTSASVDVSGAVEFWDITNREDYHVVELQQQGTRSRSWEAGRYSNQEASVHAFDLMCRRSLRDGWQADGARGPDGGPERRETPGRPGGGRPGGPRRAGQPGPRDPGVRRPDPDSPVAGPPPRPRPPTLWPCRSSR